MHLTTDDKSKSTKPQVQELQTDESINFWAKHSIFDIGSEGYASVCFKKGSNRPCTCLAAIRVNIAHDVFTMCDLPPGKLE